MNNSSLYILHMFEKKRWKKHWNVVYSNPSLMSLKAIVVRLKSVSRIHEHVCLQVVIKGGSRATSTPTFNIQWHFLMNKCQCCCCSFTDCYNTAGSQSIASSWKLLHLLLETGGVSKALPCYKKRTRNPDKWWGLWCLLSFWNECNKKLDHKR